MLLKKKWEIWKWNWKSSENFENVLKIKVELKKSKLKISRGNQRYKLNFVKTKVNKISKEEQNFENKNTKYFKIKKRIIIIIKKWI